MLIAAVSGGLDSVGMLWRLMLTTSQAVHVHHVHIRPRVDRGRWRVEQKSMERIVPWIRDRTRPFIYTESKREPATVRGADIVIVTEECAKVGLNYPRGAVTGLARGANLHDMTNGGTGRRQAQALAVWRRYWGAGAPPIVFPIANMTRTDLWAMLPPELAAMTWSCRFPVKSGEDRWQPCHVCRTCRELRAHGVPTERVYAR